MEQVKLTIRFLDCLIVVDIIERSNFSGRMKRGLTFILSRCLKPGSYRPDKLGLFAKTYLGHARRRVPTKVLGVQSRLICKLACLGSVGDKSPT